MSTGSVLVNSGFDLHRRLDGLQCEVSLRLGFFGFCATTQLRAAYRRLR